MVFSNHRYMVHPNHKMKIYFLFLFLLYIFWNCASPPEPEPDPVVEEKPEPIPIVVIPPSPPEKTIVKNVIYDLDKMTINWESSLDSNFKQYTLLTSKGNSSQVDTLVKIFNVKENSYHINQFDPTTPNWFWVRVTNISNLSSESDRVTHTLETKNPVETNLLPLEYDGLLRMRWNMNDDYDFFYYNIYQSRSGEIDSFIKTKTLNARKDTMFVLPMDSIYYYKIGVEDRWGLESYSNILKGDYLVDIWENKYSIINTRRLDLPSEKSINSIPLNIKNLLHLEELRLSNNTLSGNIPEHIFELNNIKVLDLSNNQLTGKIPAGISKLNNLEELWLSNNSFVGEIPYQIFTMENVTHLNLSDNNITGNISESIGNLKKLEYLNFWNNDIDGMIPVELGSLVKLEFLSLAGNKLKGEIPKELGNAISLKSIALFENRITGEIPDEITRLPYLEYLGLFDNMLEGEVSDELLSPFQLSYLRLDKNKLSTIDHDSMCRSGYNWDNMIYYNLTKNNFDSPFQVCFIKPELEKIYSKSLNK